MMALADCRCLLRYSTVAVVAGALSHRATPVGDDAVVSFTTCYTSAQARVQLFHAFPHVQIAATLAVGHDKPEILVKKPNVAD